MIEQNVIWIASYPKSGNTWIHSVLRRAGLKYGFPQVDMDIYNILRNRSQLSICNSIDQQFSQTPVTVIKTHSQFRDNVQMHQYPDLEFVNKAYIHVYRNPLDVLLSYLNYTRLEYKAHVNDKEYTKKIFTDMLGLNHLYSYDEWLDMNLDSLPVECLDHALDYFSDNDMTLPIFADMSGSWLENTRSWLAASQTLPGYSLRYEDCLVDPEQFFKLTDFFIFSRNDVISALKDINNEAISKSVGGNQEYAIFFNEGVPYFV